MEWTHLLQGRPLTFHPRVSVRECKIRTNGTIWGWSRRAWPGFLPPSIPTLQEHSLPLSHLVPSSHVTYAPAATNRLA